MIGKRKKRSTLDMGHDAFLDIVANLVGVLIILIAVFSGASAAMVEEAEQRVEAELRLETQAELASEEQLANLARMAARANRAHHDSDHLEAQIRRFDAEINLRNQERAALLDLQAIAQAAWEEKQTELDRSKTEAAKIHTEVAIANEQLQQLRGERKRLENLPEPVVALQHLPTPMAKKVYEDRITLRLRGDHVSVVPTDALMNEVAQQVRRTANGRGRPKLNDVVGPVRGYTAHYTLIVENRMIGLEGAIFQPLTDPIGQSIDQVLEGASEIESELAGRDPNSTSVMVWAYADSFQALRKLKEYLYSKGYATAVRPREMHDPIGISVSGTDPQAQ